MKKNKIIALILSVLMLASCVPFVTSAGEVDTGNGTGYEDGTTLLKMDTLVTNNFENVVTERADGVKLGTVNFPGAQFDEEGNLTATNGQVFVGENGSSYCYTEKWGGEKKIGTNTNLPLNENTEYTISFDLKPGERYMGMSKERNQRFGFAFTEADGSNPTGDDNDSRWGGFGWSIWLNNPESGCKKYPQITGFSRGTNTNAVFVENKATTLTENIWKIDWTDSDSDGNCRWSAGTIDEINSIGFTHFDFEIDGYTVRIYIENKHVATYTVNTNSTSARSYKENETLGLYVGGNVADYTGDAEIYQMQGLVVTAGNIMSDSKVEFKGVDGNVVKTQYVTDGDIISEFPTVTASEGNAIKWFYEGTDILASAPYTVDGDAVLVAREVDTSTFTAVVGEQHTKPADNKQDIRFLAVLDTTEGSEVGFKITAEYEGGTKEWYDNKTRTSTVYTSIKATDTLKGDGSTVADVSAELLGGKYVIAIAINGVDTTVGEITFTVQSFITVGGEDQLSEPITFTFNGGERV